MTETATLEAPPARDAATARSRQPDTDRAALRELLRPVRGRLATAVVVQAFASVVGLVPFVAVAELGRTLLADPVDADRVRLVVAVGAGALVVRLALLVVALATTHFADNDLQLDIRRRLVTRLGRVPLGWFTERNSGEVKKAMQDDVGAMHHLVAHSLIDLTAAVVTPLFAFAYLLWVDWRLALVTLLPVLVGMLLYRRSMTGYGEQMLAYDRALGRVNSSAVEFVHGISVVKTFGQAGKAHRRFATATDEFATFFHGWARSVTRVSTLAEIVFAPVTMLFVVLSAGTLFVTAGWVAPVDLLPAVLLGVALTAPVLTLGYTAQQLRMARLAASNVCDLLDTPTLPAATGEPAPAGNRVVLDDVSFSYGAGSGRNDSGRDDKVPVLRGIDLVLEPGTVTALVGPSGAGKSTLARLLPRFWDVDTGSITIGGVDVRELLPSVLYRRVGFVFQDVQLLGTSVADNIRLARPDAGADEVRAAAVAAQVHDRIARLPRGYDSVIGKDARLSAGEAQRVSIARALLADAPILVLDEATAFADPESEAAIQDALSTLVAGRTLLVIAHRLPTVTGADQIVVLDEQRIVERGRHEQLLAARGLYARMWATYEKESRRSPGEGGTR